MSTLIVEQEAAKINLNSVIEQIYKDVDSKEVTDTKFIIKCCCDC